MKNRKMKSYLYGMKKAIPVLIGFLPIAITYAIMAIGAGLNIGETIGMSACVFAGASQIMATQMLADGASAVSIIMATFVLNLRHIIMSTCVFNRLRCKNILLRLISGFGITDETFALFTTEEEERCDEYFMLGLITVSYLSWVLGALIGVFASNLLPQSLAKSFGVALYALFLALIVPDIKRDWKLFFTVLLTVLLNILFGLFMESSWAIICATLIGAAAGAYFMERGNGNIRADMENGGSCV